MTPREEFYDTLELLGNYELLPKEVQEVVSNENLFHGDMSFEDNDLAIAALEEIGWTADYDLSGELYCLRPKQKPC